jgi:dTDP-4-dehydrorhamnose reductase
MPKTVLVLGATGMLGHKLVQVMAASDRHEVHASVRTPVPEAFRIEGVRYHPNVSLARGSAALRALLAELRPDVVVNAVGAIKQKDLAAALDETYFVNATLPHLIAVLNPNPEGKVIHFSTDCVFRGERGDYTEADRPDVEDIYGRSKACGELDYGRHLTIRTSIIGFEIGGHLSLLSWLFRQPSGSSRRGYRRAIFSGLPTRTLARTVADILERAPALHGLYHVASEPITKYDLLCRLNEAFELGVGDPRRGMTHQHNIRGVGEGTVWRRRPAHIDERFRRGQRTARGMCPRQRSWLGCHPDLDTASVKGADDGCVEEALLQAPQEVRHVRRDCSSYLSLMDGSNAAHPF